MCGAVHKDETIDALHALTAVTELGDVIRTSTPYAHPEFPAARTATPLLVRADISSDVYRSEHFGPAGFVIACTDRAEALARATDDAQLAGSIANYVYSTDSAFLDETADAFALSGASVGFNLLHQRPINFTAAFSDYHVSGLNPAGNACLTDISFVASRFRIVQTKHEV